MGGGAKTSACTSPKRSSRPRKTPGTTNASGRMNTVAVVRASMVASSTSPAKTLPKSRIERLRGGGRARRGGGGEGKQGGRQPLAGEDVAEEPHREADDARQLADQVDRGEERGHVGRLRDEQLLQVATQAVGAEPERDERDERDERQPEREVEVGGAGAHERHDDLLAVDLLGQANGADPRQEAPPVRDAGAAEDGEDQRRELAPALATGAADDTREEFDR